MSKSADGAPGAGRTGRGRFSVRSVLEHFRNNVKTDLVPKCRDRVRAPARDAIRFRRVMPDPLDLRGLKCPLVVLKIRRAMAAVAPGGALAVVADDPLALLDVPVMCHHARFTLHEARKDADGRIHFRIEKPPGWVKPSQPGPIK